MSCNLVDSGLPKTWQTSGGKTLLPAPFASGPFSNRGVDSRRGPLEFVGPEPETAVFDSIESDASAIPSDSMELVHFNSPVTTDPDALADREINWTQHWMNSSFARSHECCQHSSTIPASIENFEALTPPSPSSASSSSLSPKISMEMIQNQISSQSHDNRACERTFLSPFGYGRQEHEHQGHCVPTDLEKRSIVFPEPMDTGDSFFDDNDAELKHFASPADLEIEFRDRRSPFTPEEDDSVSLSVKIKNEFGESILSPSPSPFTTFPDSNAEMNSWSACPKLASTGSSNGGGGDSPDSSSSLSLFPQDACTQECGYNCPLTPDLDVSSCSSTASLSWPLSSASTSAKVDNQGQWDLQHQPHHDCTTVSSTGPSTDSTTASPASGMDWVNLSCLSTGWADSNPNVDSPSVRPDHLVNDDPVNTTDITVPTILCPDQKDVSSHPLPPLTSNPFVDHLPMKLYRPREGLELYHHQSSENLPFTSSSHSSSSSSSYSSSSHAAPSTSSCNFGINNENHHQREKRHTTTAPKTRRPNADDTFLVECKNLGLSYKDIKRLGGYREAESTLRGRFRTLTKSKEQRVRKPQWQTKDIRLLCEAVNLNTHPSSVSPEQCKKQTAFCCTSSSLNPHGCPSGFGSGSGSGVTYNCRGGRGGNTTSNHMNAQHNRPPKVSWKNVGLYIVNHGGSYHFGNATCKKKWCEMHDVRL